MTKYVVTSQPRTMAKNNFTEVASSNKYYQQDEDNDQCCFVYFYSLYCSRCRCSGCCDDDKQKRRRPQRRAFNNYTSDPLYIDDTNTLNFLNDEINTYGAYSDPTVDGGNEQGGDIICHRGDFYGHTGVQTDDNNRSGDHCAEKSGSIHSSHNKEDVGHSVGLTHSVGGEYSTSVIHSGINTKNEGHIGGTGYSGHTEINSHWGSGGHCDSHLGGGGHSNSHYGGGDPSSGWSNSDGGDNCGGDTGGGDTGGGDTGGGDTGGGDTGGGDCGGGGDD